MPRLTYIYIWLSQASLLLPILAGLKNFKRLTIPFKILFCFFLLSAGFEVQSIVLIKLHHHNMFGLHLFTAIEFITFSVVFYMFFRHKRGLALLIPINIAIFMYAAISDAMMLKHMPALNPLARSYSSVSILTYTLIYFYFMFRTDERDYAITHPMFWISIGTLLYFGSNTMYFIFNGNPTVNSSIVSLIGSGIHALLNIIANYLYAQSFRCFSPKKA